MEGNSICKLLKRAEEAFAHCDYKNALHLYINCSQQQHSLFLDERINLCRQLSHKKYPPFLSILDPMFETSWDCALSLYHVPYEHWETMLDKYNFPLLVGSIWEGKNKDWLWAMTVEDPSYVKRSMLTKFLQRCRSEGRKIIFWNTEDSLHFHEFKWVARLADIIFTTDCTVIDDYRKINTTAKIGSMPFAANVKLCNPIGRNSEQQGTICFAGTNYLCNHNDRPIQLKMLLPVIEAFSGVIFDRFSVFEAGVNRFPRKYQKYIKPAIAYADMIKEFKRHKFFLNANTITDSPTMMSMRVYELLASGTPVISWPSKAIETQFHGIVQTATTSHEAIHIVEDFLNDDEKWNRLSHLGYREVMSKHTYMHRRKLIEGFMDWRVPPSNPKVSIMLATMRPQMIDRIVENIALQTYDNLEVLITTQNYSADEIEKLIRNLSIRCSNLPVNLMRNDSLTSLGMRYNKMINMARGDYIAKFDDDDYYFPNYLSDMMLAFTFTEAKIVGKHACFIYLQECDTTYIKWRSINQCYHEFVNGSTMVIDKNAFAYFSFQDKTEGEDSDLLQQAKEKGIRVYAADKYNYAIYRDKTPDAHTYKMPTSYFQEGTQLVGNGLCKQAICI